MKIHKAKWKGFFISNLSDPDPDWIEVGERRVYNSLVDPKMWHVPVECEGCSQSMTAPFETAVEYVKNGTKIPKE